jgi:hypothetical protein
MHKWLPAFLQGRNNFRFRSAAADQKNFRPGLGQSGCYSRANAPACSGYYGYFSIQFVHFAFLNISAV